MWDGITLLTLRLIILQLESICICIPTYTHNMSDLKKIRLVSCMIFCTIFIGAELGGAAGARAPPLLPNPRKFIVMGSKFPEIPRPRPVLVHLHYLEHFGASGHFSPLIAQRTLVPSFYLSSIIYYLPFS